jgi:hypothetical protein
MSEKMLRARDHAASAASHVPDAYSTLRCYVIGRFDDFRLKRMQTGQSPCVAVMNLYNEHITSPNQNECDAEPPLSGWLRAVREWF